MKIIYVPITVPWNTRSIVAMLLTLVCVVICLTTAWSPDWYHAQYQISTLTPDDLDLVVIKIGPWELKMTLCGATSVIGKRVCHDKFSVFQECHRAEGQSIDLTRFGNAQEAEFRSFTWCSGWKLSVAAWALLLLAAILGVVNLIASLIREEMHGPLSLGCWICVLLAIILFVVGATRFLDTEVPKLENFMRSNGRTVVRSVRPGVGFGFAVFGCIVWFIGTVVSMTLFCCPPKSSRVRAPRIVIVTTDRSALGGPMATIPSHPGFQSVASEPHKDGTVDYDADGPEMRTPATVSGGGGGTTATRRPPMPGTYAQGTTADRARQDSEMDVRY